MTAPQITADGILIPTLNERLEAINEDQAQNVDPLLNTQSDSPNGSLTASIVSALREVEELAKEVVTGFSADATGTMADVVALVTGTRREPSAPSRFIGTRRLIATLDVGATLDAGYLIAVDGAPQIQFRTLATVGPTLVAGEYYVPAECTEDGPVAVNTDTLTIPVTPAVGLISIRNPFPAILGKYEDTDEELLIRRETELRAAGSASAPAMAADVKAIEVDGTKTVLSVQWLENVLDYPDANGLPPHSVEILVFDGVDEPTPNDVIAQTLWDSKGGGTRLVGNRSGNALDPNGDTHVVFFSRPVPVPFKLRATLKPLPGYVGDAGVKAAVVSASVLRQLPGKSVRFSHYTGTVERLVGVDYVDAIRLARLTGDLDTVLDNEDLAISIREIATLASVDVEVVQL